MTHSARYLPYGRQQLDEDDVEAVVRVLRSDFLTTGPAVDAFEAALSEATGAAHAVAVSSGTAALHSAYAAAGLGPGDEIITVPLTFAATANAARLLGATVRFADVDPDTGTIDPDAIEPLVNDRTRLIVCVDYAGHPADYDGVRAVADRHGLTVVADAAHSLGATSNGRPVGTLADVTTTSFHPVKPITTGEGGATLTNDPEIAARARQHRNHGITGDRAMMDRDEGPWYCEMHELGLNYRLTDMQAALGVSQLRKLDAFLARRRAIAKRYTDALAEVPGLILPVTRPGDEPGWHLYVVRVSAPALRRPFFERLQAAGLGVQVHYVPVHLHPYYRRLGASRGDCPVAEGFSDCCVSLPIFPAMTDDDLEWSIAHVMQAARDELDDTAAVRRAG